MMNFARALCLTGVLGCAAWSLPGLASAAAATEFVATLGSAFVADEFTSTGPPGSLWQPVVTRHAVGALRYEVSVLRPLANTTAFASYPGASPIAANPGSAPDISAPGPGTMTLAYALPPGRGWGATVIGKQYVSSSYQKLRLGAPNYRAILVRFDGKRGAAGIESAVGYKWKTPLSGYEQRNGVYGYVGGSYDVDSTTSIELFLDYRRSNPFVVGPYAVDASTRWVRKVGNGVKLEAYATQGVTAGNRDRGLGFLVSLAF